MKDAQRLHMNNEWRVVIPTVTKCQINFPYEVEGPHVDAWLTDIQAYIFTDVKELRVLEIGCGSGHRYGYLKHRFGLVDYRAVEISPLQIAQTLKVFPELAGRILEHDIHEGLPFLDSEFDLVYTGGVLMHLCPETADICLNEMLRCSKRFVAHTEQISPRSSAEIINGYPLPQFYASMGAAILCQHDIAHTDQHPRFPGNCTDPMINLIVDISQVDKTVTYRLPNYWERATLHDTPNLVQR